MKKHSRLISFALAAILVFALIPASAAADTLVKDLKIVCLGDSITHFGSYKTGQNDEYGNAIYANSYPDHLASYTGAEVYNAGRAGDSTDMAATRVQAEVINQFPDVVVISLGMNDQAYDSRTGCNMTSVEAYRANLEKFAKTFTAQGIDVIFLTPNPVYAPHYIARANNYNYGNMPYYCNAMREVAIKYGCGLVDANYEYTSSSDLSSYILAGDGIHQSNTGRQYFASLVSEYLSAKYENNNRAQMTIVCKDTSGKILKQYTIVGAEGALITVPSPDLGEGYTATTADANTTFVNNATLTFTYTSEISNAIANAANAYVDSTMAAYISELTSVATNLLSAASLDFDAIGRTTVLLQNATKGVAVLSYGATYSAPAPTYDSYLDLDDDGIRLTDGYKSYASGWDSRYSAWTSIQPEIILDLGAVVKANTFKGYFGGLTPVGVGTPSAVNVSYSTDKTNWSSAVAAVKSTVATSNTGNSTGSWDRDMFTASLGFVAEMRYVKFNIMPTGSNTWVDELEVCYDASKAPDPNDLDATSTYTTSDLYRQGSAEMSWGWDENAPITYPDEGGNSLIDGTVGADEMAHVSWAGFHYNTPEYATTGYHRITFDLGEAKNVGTVDVYVGTAALGAGITAPASIKVYISDNGTDFKHVNTVYPTNTANVSGYTMVERVTSYVYKSARYVELRIVSGNWVFVSEVDITACETVEHSCTANGTTWYNDGTNHWHLCDCGEKVDIAEHEYPDDADSASSNVCIHCGYVSEIEFLPGDVNDDGTVDMFDYLMVKSFYFEASSPTAEQFKRAEMNQDGVIDMFDVLIVKGIYFRTYAPQA